MARVPRTTLSVFVIPVLQLFGTASVSAEWPVVLPLFLFGQLTNNYNSLLFTNSAEKGETDENEMKAMDREWMKTRSKICLGFRRASKVEFSEG